MQCRNPCRIGVLPTSTKHPQEDRTREYCTQRAHAAAGPRESSAPSPPTQKEIRSTGRERKTRARTSSPHHKGNKRLEGRGPERPNTTFLFLFQFLRCCVGFCRTTMSSAIIVHSPSLHPVDGGTGWDLGPVTSPLLCKRQNKKKQIGTKNNYTSAQLP